MIISRARPSAIAVALIIVGGALRLALTLAGWPALNSDEAVTGIMASQIAFDGAHPIYYAGQNYMGAIEAYLAAPLFWLFGPSLLAIRAGSILMDMGFFACVYLIGTLLYDARVALSALAFVVFGGPEMLVRQIEAAGGYRETLLFGSLVILLAGWLAISAPPPGKRAGVTPYHTAWGFFGLGLAAGLGFWSDFLILPYLLLAFALVAACRWRDLRSRLGALLALGMLVGVSPVIIHDLRAHGSESVFMTLWMLETMHHASPLQAPLSIGGHLAGTFIISLPNMLGADVLCSLPVQTSADIFSPVGASAAGCIALRAAWSSGFLLLGMLAVVATARPLWELRSQWFQQSWNDDQWRAATRHLARLALLLSAALTILLYVLNPGSANTPWPSERYLLPVLIAMPAVLSPMWRLRPLRLAWRGVVLPARSLRRGILMALLLAVMSGSLLAWDRAPAARATAARRAQLGQFLESKGITRVYTDYWTCIALAYETHERIVCIVMSTPKSRGLARFPEWTPLVEADPCAAWLVPHHVAAFKNFATTGPPGGARWARIRVAGYTIWQPCPPSAR